MCFNYDLFSILFSLNFENSTENSALSSEENQSSHNSLFTIEMLCILSLQMVFLIF